MSDKPESEFEARREAARRRLDRLEGGMGGDDDTRREWFDAVYRSAGGDPAGVPWADLKVKPRLAEWLAAHPGEGRTAIDVGCGLGDNAEAIAAAGYKTTAFDLSPRAIAWAKERFPKSPVSYVAADLFAPPREWIGGFDVVNECYIVQALDGAMRANAIAAIGALVAPGGRLLLTARTRPEDAPADGPPWPLTPSEIASFDALGFAREEERVYTLERGERQIPHVFIAFHRGEHR